MTFLAGYRLFFLLAPVALAVAYVVIQRTRRRTVVRFTSVDLLASVAPRRPGWQRHLSAAALVAALIVLVLAFSQPARTLRVPRQRATVMLTLDVSGSMIANDVTPSRLGAAQVAARTFVSELPSGIQLGLVTFSTTAVVRVSPTTDRSTVLAAIDQLQAGGGTATGTAINLALSAIRTVPPAADGKAAPAAIVLMSDGSPTIGENGLDPFAAVAAAAGNAKSAGVKVSTIAFGTADGAIVVQGQEIPVPWDPQAMADIASATGGSTFTASSAGQLRSVYNAIGRAVGYEVHLRNVSAWFTGAALLVALAAAVAALVWNQRLV